MPHDLLPEESPALLAELYYAAGEVPGMADLPFGAVTEVAGKTPPQAVDAAWERKRAFAFGARVE